MSCYEGIIGTVVGVVLGWFISFLNNYGRTSFYLNNVRISYLDSDNGGGFNDAELSDNSVFGTLIFEFDICNTSAKSALFRNIRCLLKSNGKEKTKTLFDESTYRVQNQASHYDKIEILNLSPKSIRKVNFYLHLDKEDLDFISKNNITVSLAGEKVDSLLKKISKKVATLENGKIN